MIPPYRLASLAALAFGIYLVVAQLINGYWLFAISSVFLTAGFVVALWHGWCNFWNTWSAPLMVFIGTPLFATIGAFHASDAIKFDYVEARSEVSTALLTNPYRCTFVSQALEQEAIEACAVQIHVDQMQLALSLMKIVYFPPLLGFADSVASANATPVDRCVDSFNVIYSACPEKFGEVAAGSIQLLERR